MIIESKAFWAIYDELAQTYDSQDGCEDMAYCIYYALWSAGLLKKYALAKGQDAKPEATRPTNLMAGAVWDDEV